MPHQSIEDLSPPPPGYRVERRTNDRSGVIKFETLEECRREDLRRWRAMRGYLASGSGMRFQRRAARELARFLRKVLNRRG